MRRSKLPSDRCSACLNQTTWRVATLAVLRYTMTLYAIIDIQLAHLYVIPSSRLIYYNAYVSRRLGTAITGGSPPSTALTGRQVPRCIWTVVWVHRQTFFSYAVVCGVCRRRSSSAVIWRLPLVPWTLKGSIMSRRAGNTVLIVTLVTCGCIFPSARTRVCVSSRCFCWAVGDC